MGRAKEIIIKVIPSKIANDFVRKHHYSGKVVNNSQLHFGAFLDGVLHGVLSYGPSLDKKKIGGLVDGTGWNEFIELNRMAFDDVLPRNSESRCISISFKLLKKNAPQIKWVVSFADGTQCGDGTIYRASGFLLTGLKKNNQIWEAPSVESFSRMSLTDGRSKQQQAQAIISRTTMTKGNHILENGASSMKNYKDAGWTPKIGFQLRYIYFLDPSYKSKLTCPILPFSKIDDMNARMYKGERLSPRSKDSVVPGSQSVEGGANPTLGLL